MAKKLTQKHLAREQHQVLIVFAVSIVAILAIISANQSTIGGSAVYQTIECTEEKTCLEWDWVDVEDLPCSNSEFVEYPVCEEYSWESGEMTCVLWNTIYKEECVELEKEVLWDRQCSAWSIKTICPE